MALNILQILISVVLVVVILVLWLCGLGLVDLIETRRVQRKMLAALRLQTPDLPVADAETPATASDEARE